MDKKWINITRKWVDWLPFLSLLIASLLINQLSNYPYLVEKYYSTGIFPWIATAQRWLFGWMPFSFGDITYVGVLGIGLVKIIQCSIRSFQQKITISNLVHSLRFLANIALSVYLIFHLFWGLNYTRLGIAYQLGISQHTYSAKELHELNCDLVEALNTTRISLGDSLVIYPDLRQTFRLSSEAYLISEKQFPFLRYRYPAIKPSLLTEVVSYAGYSGYYNPFSGEAQVNTDLPAFLQPFVCAHEMAHQLGYASEGEANFVAYLTALNAKDSFLHYSALFELFLSANAALMEIDFDAAVLNNRYLHKWVRQDKRIYRNFLLGKKNKLEPVIKSAYDQYLKANQQERGILSYDEWIGWAIAYQKKYG